MNSYKVPQLPGKKNKNSRRGRGLNNNKGNKNNNSGFLTAGRIILLTFLSLVFLFLLLMYLFLNFYRPPVSDTPGEYDFIDEFADTPATNPNGEAAVPVQTSDNDLNPDCYTFLILGIDNIGGTTDTMMLAMLNVKEDTISILNIPRDTYVSSKNYSGKINGVYAAGRGNAIRNGTPKDKASDAGIAYLKAMIKYTFGIPIQKHVLINLEGLKTLVDSIKGVEVNVPLRMYYTDPEQNLYIDLQPGLQLLDGNKAEQFIRFRHGNDGYPGYPSIGYPSEDIGRIQSQQHFIAALMKKLLNPIDLNNIKNLFSTASKYMITNMNLTDIAWFGTKMTGVKLENIRTHTVPGNWISSVLRYEAYKAETMEIINKYYNPYNKDIPEDNFNIYDNDLIGWNGYKPEIDIDGSTMDKLGS